MPLSTGSRARRSCVMSALPPPGEEARALGEVGPGFERRHEPRDLGRVGRTVGIDHHDDFAGDRGEAGTQRIALSDSRLCRRPGSPGRSAARDLDGASRRVAVDQDHLVEVLGESARGRGRRCRPRSWPGSQRSLASAGRGDDRGLGKGAFPWRRETRPGSGGPPPRRTRLRRRRLEEVQRVWQQADGQPERAERLDHRHQALVVQASRGDDNAIRLVVVDHSQGGPRSAG